MMIKINLLPANLRRKEKTSLEIPMAAILVLTVLIILGLHILLGLLTLYKKAQIIALNSAQNNMSAQFREISDLKSSIKDKKDRIKTMDYILTRKFYWTAFINKINSAVPKRLWLNQLSLSKSGLVIEGSVFSFAEDEVSLVNKFFDTLKNDAFFMGNFRNFNIDSMQRRNIKTYEVLDFLLTAENIEEVKVDPKDKSKLKRKR